MVCNNMTQKFKKDLMRQNVACVFQKSYNWIGNYSQKMLGGIVMRKSSKAMLMAIVLVLTCICGDYFSNTTADAAIYFAGHYMKVIEYDGYSDYYELVMNQYSSPEGKKVGNFELIQYSTYRENAYVKGTLKRVKRNKYQCKKGKIKFTFIVKRNKVIVKQNKTSIGIPVDFTNKYKCLEHYYS